MARMAISIGSAWTTGLDDTENRPRLCESTNSASGRQYREDKSLDRKHDQSSCIVEYKVSQAQQHLIPDVRCAWLHFKARRVASAVGVV